MIFVVVGTQLPFDRMVRAVDRWAQGARQETIFAQIGPTRFRPQHMKWESFLSPAQFEEKLSEASLVIAHAGMGTIIGALRAKKRIVVFPREASRGEQRNDHQLATARALGRLGYVAVAFGESDLCEYLSEPIGVQRPPAVGPYASARLLNTVGGFVSRVSRSRSGAS